MIEQVGGLRKDRGVERKRAFLRAGRHVFFEHGYLAASVNDVVKQAGGSLATLYSQFHNKEGLFFAVVRDYLDEGEQAVAPMDIESRSFEAGLNQLGERCLERMLSREALAFYRIIVSEGSRFPPAVRSFLNDQPASFMRTIEAFIVDGARSAGRTVADPGLAAQYFLVLVATPWRMRALIDPRDTPTPEERRAHVETAVHTFLAGVH